jgi:glycosyltransferase involved in cell wall biosynthesis
MTTLRVILDEMISSRPGGAARYTEELTRALIRNAPAGAEVAGIIASSPAPDYDRIATRLPGLGDLFKSALSRQQLTSAWQHGFTRVPSGMLHAPSLFAPLRRHDRVNSRANQTIVTIHDVEAWTHPESVGARKASWTRAMANRAFKYADAVVVPTHAAAAELDEIIPFGDRLRIIGGAVSSRLSIGDDAAERAEGLALPERYLLTIDGSGTRHGLTQLLAALALPGATDLPLLVVGEDDTLAASVVHAGLPPERVVGLGHLSDADLSVVLDRATVAVFPTLVDGFGISLLEAFHFGAPVVHSDNSSLVEVAGGAGIAVEYRHGQGYAARLGEAIAQIVDDEEFSRRLGILGQDRAGLFSWRASAEQVWQLHADL